MFSVLVFVRVSVATGQRDLAPVAPPVSVTVTAVIGNDRWCHSDVNILTRNVYVHQEIHTTLTSTAVITPNIALVG